uniref:Uncharacterized protein n=1 Tax=Latimeria chalumnae TaxID=7897 RepID=H3A4E3_LATCH
QVNKQGGDKIWLVSLEAGNLAAEWKSLKRLGIPTRVVNILLVSCKNSDSKIYYRVWNIFSQLCEAKSLCAKTATLANILELLQNGVDKGVACSSSKVQVSALGAIRGEFEVFPFGSHPLISHFLNALCPLKPSLKNIVPAWDLNLVLNTLYGTLTPTKHSHI